MYLRHIHKDIKDKGMEMDHSYHQGKVGGVIGKKNQKDPFQPVTSKCLPSRASE